MENQPPPNPFVPGRGLLPPYLAGRDAEQSALKGLLAYVNAGKGAPRGTPCFSGPRGNGKTVLLHWFQNEIEASKSGVDVVFGDAGRVLKLGKAYHGTHTATSFRGVGGPTRSRSPSASANSRWILGGALRSLTALLTARCKQRPLVLLLDEAHTLDREVGPSAPERKSAGRCPSAFPDGSRWHAGPSSAPQYDVRHLLEPCHEAGHRSAGRSCCCCCPDTSVRRDDSGRRLCRASLAARG